MRKFEYKPPRVHSGELRTPVIFYQYVPIEGPYPGEEVKQVLYSPWAKIDEVWLRDVELAKSNGTLSDVTIIIRDPQGDYIPTNKHYVEIDAPEYKGKHFNVKQAQPDMQNKAFINVIAELTS
ncbi:hypothetical protein SAMN05216232_1987 [Virgibacillus subterraneus]|uniref:Phage head-tail adapter protein n=1 Tax=Virgibacillus subterraneus TaxID=621109 RepID=A0A1H9EDC1_9BACI|nr:phage head-tail adapter protein [Virgibacillus subterraneus]SEQ23552.1 hypothetical protein SAMN05216232_1987 [Virgibacillus subterraneus]